jgi:hypothetical protein
LAVYQRILGLAGQIESHAELAPYPHMGQQLRQIAQEKHTIADRLKRIIETIHGPTPKGSQPPATGKNQWRRLIRDLEDQRELDNLLARFEFTITREVPEMRDFLDQVKSLHHRHRTSLIELIAVSDPQASQT